MIRETPIAWKQWKSIRRAMRLGAHHGYDPYNSAVTFARFYW